MLTPIPDKIAIFDYHLRRRKVFQQFEPQITELHEQMLRALLDIDAEFYRQHPHLIGLRPVEKVAVLQEQAA